MEKESYLIEHDGIQFRRARKEDDLQKIAELIYKTDPYIYPFWFNNNIEEAKKVLSQRMNEEGFIFNYNNFYVAYEPTLNKIVGVIGAIDPTVNLSYDYTSLCNINYAYKFTIDNYIKELIKEVQTQKYMYVTNICIDESYREKRIGHNLLEFFMNQMEKAGFDDIGFDCLMHNLRAKNLYHSLGFKEVADGIGFDGTECSTVEVVFFRKKLNAEKYNYQYDLNTNVKEIDQQREKELFKRFNQKKQ